MLIYYRIHTWAGTILEEGEFNSEDRNATRNFAIRAKQAWEDGCIVSTMKKRL